jgi:hypothetical protein
VPAAVKISQYGLRYIKLIIELMKRGDLLLLLHLHGISTKGYSILILIFIKLDLKRHLTNGSEKKSHLPVNSVQSV